MKNAKVENRKENRKIVKAAQPRRVAGVPVRSGVKAGRMHDFGSGHQHFGEPGRPGGPGGPGGLF